MKNNKKYKKSENDSLESLKNQKMNIKNELIE